MNLNRTKNLHNLPMMMVNHHTKTLYSKHLNKSIVLLKIFKSFEL